MRIYKDTLMKLQKGLCFVLLFTVLGGGACYATGLSSQELQASLQEQVDGVKNAPVTIVEYSSLTCPYCARFSMYVYPKIKEKYIKTGKVRFVFKAFPIEGYVAVQAEQIARCVVPSNYIEMRHAIFEGQNKWLFASMNQKPLTNKGPYKGMTKGQKNFFVTLAKLEGGSDRKIEACLNNKTLETNILKSRMIGEKKDHVEATPTFFINGKKYVGFQSFNMMSHAIEQALEKKK